jgi:hypothetical protein
MPCVNRPTVLLCLEVPLWHSPRASPASKKLLAVRVGSGFSGAGSLFSPCQQAESPKYQEGCAI